MMRTWAVGGILVCLAWVMVTPKASADSLSEIFQTSNEAYFRQDFQTAAEGYLRLFELGVIDADVSFNLATAYARQREYGRAVQYFEQTLWLRPGDAGAEAALSSVRAAIGQRRAARAGEAEVQTAPPLDEALFGGFSPDALAINALIMEFAFFLLLAVWLFTRREKVRIAFGMLAPVLGLLFLVSITGLVVRTGAFDDGVRGVVVHESVALREGPTAEASVRARAPEGRRAWILEESEDHVRVRVEGVGQGWARRVDIGSVVPRLR